MGEAAKANSSEERDRLIGLAGDGQLSAEEAEAKAAELGIGPLASQPDPTEFDPDKEQYWTITMAVAWIAYRSKDAVRDCWAAYRAECWEWTRCNWQGGS